jgi:tetratricopeptide (TPR) repeat protein
MKKSLCLIAALFLSFTSVACTKIQARMSIKEGNEAYAQEKWATAVEKYKEARELDSGFAELDRLIGYSYIGLYKPDVTTPANEKNADLAVKELSTYLKKKPEDTVAREALINLYLNSNRTSQAIDYFREYLKTHPADLSAVRSIAQLYAKQGDFNESLNWYEKITLLDAKNPEAYYVFGVVCYEKAAKNPPADMVERVAIIDRGKRALQRAIDLKSDYFEANVYMNLLWREHAKIEPDPLKQQEYVAKADEYRNKAIAINKARKEKSA